MARKKIDRKDKRCHREFVWLAPSEYEHLVQLMGNAQVEQYIEDLNGYIGSIGDKYVSHYYTIMNWHRRDLKNRPPSPSTPGDARAEANILIAALRKHRALPPDLPQAVASGFRRMFVRLKACQMPTPTWPMLHDGLSSGAITDEQIIEQYLA